MSGKNRNLHLPFQFHLMMCSVRRYSPKLSSPKNPYPTNYSFTFGLEKSMQADLFRFNDQNKIFSTDSGCTRFCGALNIYGNLVAFRVVILSPENDFSVLFQLILQTGFHGMNFSF